MNTLRRDFLDKIQYLIIERFGGSHGILNESAIETAINSPFVSMFGNELFADDISKICKLFYSLVSAHGYRDGNKRIGIFMFLYLLDENRISYNFSHNFLINITLEIASGKITREELESRIRNKLNLINK